MESRIIDKPNVCFFGQARLHIALIFDGGIGLTGGKDIKVVGLSSCQVIELSGGQAEHLSDKSHEVEA